MLECTRESTHKQGQVIVIWEPCFAVLFLTVPDTHIHDWIINRYTRPC